MTKEQSETVDNASESSSDDGKEQSRKDSENDSGSSSNGRGSGSGSGRGYNGDCSSDDASSSESSSKRKAAPELAVSVQSMDINERRDERNEKAIQLDEVQGSKAKKSKEPWQAEDQQYNSWDVASATQVAIQINALAAIIAQNRRLAEEHAIPTGENITLPQWNGIRISHPMDPRIDLRTVGHIPGSNVPVAPSDATNMHVNMLAHENVAPPTVDNYLNLMEAVRPYFHSYGFPLPPPPIDPSLPAPDANGVGSDNNGGTGSSEGFTAFFTSTEKSQSSDSSDRKSHNKSTETKPAKSAASIAAGAPAAVKEQGEAPCLEKNDDCADESDSSSSSMIVLARVKRKHQRRLHAEGDGESNGSGQPDGNDASPNRTEKDQNEEIQMHNPPPPNEAPESSSSSSSDSNAHGNVGLEGRHNFQQHHDGAGQVHIVSETNTASNTSGSGSGGNSGSNSGTNSGSGSNGSGNENPGSSGSGNEGKGSSDDAVAKDDNSGGDGNLEPFAMDFEKLETHVHRTSLAGDEFSQEDEMSRENRLLDKKRKRMNMRREYEEQVQQDLDSEDSPEEVEIRPGKPVTLDAVLSFTKIARYGNKSVLSYAKASNLTFIRVVVQSTPPFLVVHANAAFTTLTGIDSHAIIGKPIRTILSVPESKRGLMLTEFDHSDGVHSGQSSMTNSATVNRQLDDQAGRGQEHVQDALRQQYESSSGILHYEAAAAAGHARANSNEVVEVNVERLVAASGYGQVHVLHVSAKPHHMLGRNVTVFREAHRGTEHNRDARQGEQGSNGSSLASNDAPFQFMACRIGVSPVVSSSQGIDFLSPQVVADHENSNKRRKHHHQHPHRRHQRNSLVTHFCIQLEKALPTSPENPQRPSGGALPHSMAIRKIPDGQDRAEPHAALNREVDELSTQSSDLREPVTAIG